MTALAHGAASAMCVDSSQAALDCAQANAQATALRSRSMHEDAFDALKSLAQRGERFDVVILDPPAFIKRKKDIPQGQAAYRKLNQLALGVLAAEGLLVSCSCSYHLRRGAARRRSRPPRATPGASCSFSSWRASPRITRCIRQSPRRGI